MMGWRLTITRVDNGYQLRGGEELESVIQDDDKDALSSHEQLLWLVMDYFNFRGTKHDPERLRVVREKREE